MKGKDLADNDDSEYKKTLLQLMTMIFEVNQGSRVGELELVVEG